MDSRPAENLLPMTILDGMILVAGCAVSAWLFRQFAPSVFWPPEDLDAWLILTAFVQYGPTVVCPVLLGVQLARGRRYRLFPGETAWLIVALELSPFAFEVAMDRPGFGWYWNWLEWGSPPFVIVCAIVAWVRHFQTGRPRYWMHRLGLAILLAQCVPSGIWISGWFQ